MVSQPIMIIGAAILILVVLALALNIISSLTGENIANKTCKEWGGHFDPAIFTVVGIRFSHILCDIVMPIL